MDEHVEAALMEAGARINALVANERRLIDELATLRKDAERYRWLRHGDNDDICIEFAEGVDCYADDVWLLRGEKLDAVIDAGIEHDAKAAEHVAVGPGLGAA